MPDLPPELLNQVGVTLELVIAVLTALLVAFWVGLAIWTLRDIRARTRDFFAWILATVLVLLGGPIGWLLYFLLRPRETLAEGYDRQLEEEALLRDITSRRACPTCQSVTEPDWLLCPHCRTPLRHTCTACNRPLELDWVACPYCTAPVGGNGTEGRVPLLARPPLWTAEPQPEPERSFWTPGPQPRPEPPQWTSEPQPEPEPLVATRPVTGDNE